MKIQNLINLIVAFILLGVLCNCASATFCNGCYYYIEDWTLPMDQNKTIWMIRVNDQIKYDDGVMNGSFAIGKSTDIHGRGHAIRFSPPSTPYTITNVSIYGRYYCNNTQTYCDAFLENQNFSIYILDSNLKYLGGGSYRYLDYFDTNWKWVTIPISDVQVNGDFYVFIDTNSSHPAEDWYSGISIGYDTSDVPLVVSYVMDWAAAKPEIYPDVVSYTNPLHANLDVYFNPDEVVFGLIDYQMFYDEGNSTILGIVNNKTGVSGFYSIDYYPGPWDTCFPVLDCDGNSIYATSLLNQSERNFTFFRGYYKNSTTNWREAALVVRSPILEVEGVYVIETGEFLSPTGEFIPQAAKFIGGYGNKHPVWVNLTTCNLETLKVKWTTASNGTYLVFAKAAAGEDEIRFTKQIKVENRDLKPPIANFTFHPPNPLVGENVTFDASGSYDPDGYIVNYEWDFGEAFVAESSNPFINHTYYYPGTYTVWLKVTDNNGLSNSTSREITVSQPVVEINSCTVINKPGYYMLVNNLTVDSPSVCIKITSNDVVFDGFGHILDSGGIEVFNQSMLSNITIINVTIQNTSNGIVFREVRNGKIENCTIQNVDFGIYILYSDNIIISSNRINNFRNYGIFISSSGKNIISSNIIDSKRLYSDELVNGDVKLSQPTRGIFIKGSSDSNTIVSNTIQNSETGIYLFAFSFSNNISSNIIQNNSNGIVLRCAKDNTILSNTLQNNSNGVYLEGCGKDLVSSNNSIVLNTIENNQKGIYITYKSENNTIFSNYIINNIVGIYIDYAENNLIYNNIFNNTNNEFLNHVGAIKINTETYKVVYFSFGFEAINNKETRDIVMYNVINWLYGTNPSVLLVDDDNGNTYENYYISTLNNLGLVYEYWNTSVKGTPLLANLSAYDIVIWFTGDDWVNTLTTEEQSVIEQYLDSGGKLFITGQYIGLNLIVFGNDDGVFYSRYLHAILDVPVNTYSLTGIDNDPISDGLIINISGGDGANNQNWPDGILPADKYASVVFNYFKTEVPSNIWNVSKQTDTNIIGGNFIGGNAWLKPDERGFSQTCNDANLDGICDSPYQLNENNVDYLPLALHIADTDSDGIPDSEESGDWNNDGIADSKQSDVATVITESNIMAFESQNQNFSNVKAENISLLPPPPVDLPYGIYSFNLTVDKGSSIQVTLYIYDANGNPIDLPSDMEYWKYTENGNGNPTGDIGWYNISSTVIGNTITFALTDGGIGDSDGIKNGIISDPGGPGMPQDQPPVANANGPYIANEGETITFNASASYDPEGYPLQYRWDFNNDGVWDTDWLNDSTVNHVYKDDYQGVVVLEVGDGVLNNTTTANVTVLNVPPSVSVSASNEVYAGAVLNLTVEFEDPGDDSHTAVIDWGDGFVDKFDNAISPINASHVYNKGVYTISVAVTDDDGGVGLNSTNVVVKTVNATIDCNPDTINLKSNGKWITCYIELEEGNVTQINGSTVYLEYDNKTIPAYIGKQGWAKSEATDGNIVDSDGDGLLERMVKFDRSMVKWTEGDHVFYVKGKVLYNGSMVWFEGNDVLRIINNGKEKGKEKSKK